MKSAGRVLFFILTSVAWMSFTLPSASAQERWSKVRIIVLDREALHQLIRMGVDFEGARGTPGGPIECIVSDDVLKRLQSGGITPEILIEDLVAFYASRLTPGPANALGFGYGSMGGYYTLSEIGQQLDSLRTLYPNVVGAKDSIGASLQGRPIWAVRMTANPDVPSIRPQVLYFAMLHAREPMGMMTLLHTMWKLAEGYGADPEATYLLDNRDLWFVPIVNVDGYEANRRMAPRGGGARRKNMRGVINDNDPYGVDLNRNWDSFWGCDDIGSSPNPDWGDYRGVGPFSEPETQVMRDFCKGKSFRFSFEYHAFWNATFSPPLYDNTAPIPDSLLFRAYLRELTGLNHYSNGMSPSFYPVNGGANDWLYFYYHPIPGVTVFPFVTEVGDDLDGLWPSTARILPLAAGNHRANIFAAWAGGAFPKLRQTIVSDSSGDGDLEAGEAFRVQIRLHNFGQDPALMTGVSVAPRGPFLDLPSAPVVLSRLEPHADTVLTLNGRVGDGAPEGFENGIIVSVSPAPQIQFRDTVSLILGKSTLLFADGAEGGTGNWSMELDWGIAGRAHSGNSSFTDSPLSSYRNSSISGMTLRSPIAIPLTQTVTRLQFWGRWSTEPGYDHAQVFASTDGGYGWQVVSGSHASCWNGFVYTGWEPDWVKEDIDLSHLAGKEVLLRFQFYANASVSGDGFYVDDIVLKSYAATGSRIQQAEPVNFPMVEAGEADTLSFTLRNLGTAPLTVSGFSNNATVFSIAAPSTLPLVLPGTMDSAVIRVAFHPTENGLVLDTLRVASNDPLNPVMSVPLSGFGFQAGQAEAGVIYAASTVPASSLFSMSTSTAGLTPIGPLKVREMLALAVDPATKELRGLAAVGSDLVLYRLSVGGGTAMASLTLPLRSEDARAMAYYPDSTRPSDQKLYIGTLAGALIRVNEGTGTCSLIGTAPGVKYSAMSFSPVTGELWAADYSGMTRDGILKVNTATGDTQLVGRLGGIFAHLTLSMAFDNEGNLFALRGAPSGRAMLMRVDTLTGAGMLIDTVDIVGLESFAMRTDIVVGIEPDPGAGVPVAYELRQNYPNPFNPSTTIRYSLPSRSRVTLTVYNTLGQKVRTLVDEVVEAGYHEIQFDARDLSSGVYFYRLAADQFTATRRLVLIR